jgi:hypothetical protein
MKLLVERWLKDTPPVPGVLAIGVRFVDKSTVSRSWSDAFPEESLDQAWQCTADVFQVLKLNRLPADRFRWIYEQALLYCERRADGTCLGVFTARDPQGIDVDGVAKIIQGFHAMAE